MSIQISGPVVLPDGSVTAVKIDSGAAPDGQVLTADGAGGAAWEAAAGVPITGGTMTGPLQIVKNNSQLVLSHVTNVNANFYMSDSGELTISADNGGIGQGRIVLDAAGGSDGIGMFLGNNVTPHVEIYDSSAEYTYFYAVGDRVGIGTVSPTAALHVPASTTARASLRVPDGTAPTTPNDGDIWAVSGRVYARLGGVTKEFTLV